MRPVLALCLVALLAAADPDPYSGWWGRADAALIAGDGAAAGRLAADPPPAAAGGPALLHHRLLRAWLAGDAAARARLGGVLAAVRAAEAPALRLLMADAPLHPVPEAGPAAFQPEAVEGPAPWRDFVRVAAAGDGDGLVNVPLFWEHQARAWRIDPEVARARTGLAAAPPAVAPDEIEAVRFLACCLRAPMPDDAVWASAAAQAFRYRVRRDCPAVWSPAADELSASATAAKRGDRLLALCDAARSGGAAGRLALPALRAWVGRRAVAQMFGWTWQAGAGIDLLAHCGDDPAAAGREATAFRSHLAAFAATLPAAAEAGGGPAEHDAARPASAAVQAGLVAWCSGIAGFAAANHAVGRPLAGWTAAEVAAGRARLEAFAATVEGAELGAPVAERESFGWLAGAVREALGAAFDAQAQALAAPGPDAEAARDAAVAEVAVANARAVAALPALATLMAATGHAQSVPALPAHLGLGDHPAAWPIGCADPAAGADAALLAACPAAPARALAERLVALRRGNASAAELAAAVERWRRRSAAYRALAVAQQPQLDLLQEAAAAGAPVAAALIAAARSGQEPAPSATVADWLTAVARPLPGSATAAPGGRPEPWLAAEILAFRANDLDPAWGELSLWLREAPRPPERLAEIEALSRIVAPDERARAAAAGLAAWAWEEQHTVAHALATLVAHDWRGRDAFLAAARDWLATRPEEHR